MKVIVCGAGQVGFHIARQLAAENNDVTIVDQSLPQHGVLRGRKDVRTDVDTITG